MKKAKFLLPVLLLTLALLLSSASSARAFTIEVSGNGADSDNEANFNVSRETEIVQTNNADVDNSVKANSNTGNNEAEDNTGGDVGITTGDATTNLTVNNSLNANKIKLGCCDPIDAAVSVSGNGADSDNKVTLNFNNNLNIYDAKWLDIDNNFWLGANTGGNSLSGNTGGNGWIKTGNAWINVNIDNAGNFNEIIIGALKPPAPGEGPGPLPTPGSVLAAAKTLPITGFDYPFRLLVVVSLALIGAGLILRRNGVEGEEALALLAERINRIRSSI